jgi:hypothetical protein
VAVLASGPQRLRCPSGGRQRAHEQQDRWLAQRIGGQRFGGEAQHLVRASRGDRGGDQRVGHLAV